MKKAFIDQIMLGFFLIAFTMVFVGTVSDELKARNKYTGLKKTLQTVVLSASKYYINENNNTIEAQNIALGIVEQTILGQEIKNDIVFTWDFEGDPNNVKAKIDLYEEEFFWFRLLGWNSVDFEDIEAKANIVLLPTDELPIVDETSNFMPFAINECGQENPITPGDSFSFIYKSYGIFENIDSTGFYGLVLDDEPDRDDDSQDGFAHFKNEVLDFNRILYQTFLVDSDQDSIENDAQQLASALEVHKFTEPMNISVALLSCDSTKDNIVISNLIDVSMTNIYCGDKATSDNSIETAFEDQTGDVFDNINWVEWVESKDCSQSGLFRIDIDISIPQIENIILEY